MPKRTKTIFAAITKVDAATQTVTGIAMQEVVDRTNEKCLYEESKPYFIAWSDTQNKASGGKSKGNVRVMHTAKVAGILNDLTCDDARKAFVVTAEIVDPTEWALVEKGAYTGFSIGANFARDAEGKKRCKSVDGILEWVADPCEVSLVDIPCVQTATFDLAKADGTIEARKFIATGELTKGMYSVSEMGYALSTIGYLTSDLEWEADIENDGSQIPGRLRDWLKEGAEIFLDLATEETEEFAAQLTAFKAVKAERQKRSGDCGCDCAGCSGCGKKAVTPTQTKEANDEMNPEQQKALNDTLEALKGLAPTLEALKGVPAAVTTIGEQQKAMDTRLKSLEDSIAGLEELEKAFGEAPAAAKTVSPVAAVAIAREPEAAKATSSKEILKGDLTHDKAKRLEGFKSLYAEGGNAGSGFIS